MSDATRELRCHVFKGKHVPGCEACTRFGHSACTCDERGKRCGGVGADAPYTPDVSKALPIHVTMARRKSSALQLK